MKTIRTLGVMLTGLVMGVGPASAQLAVEPIPSVATLPKEIQKEWLFVQDLSFYSLAASRVYIVDPLAKGADVLGIIDTSMMAPFALSMGRNEIYAVDAFYSRGMRGDRTDFLTIRDIENLATIAQIELPGGKSFQSMTQKGALQLTNNGKFALVFNFTPAASVYVVDLDKRELVNEIMLPGCMLVYPSGDAGFASLCGSGAMIGFDLDADGQVAKEYMTEIFNDIDADPMFMKTARVGDIAYFPTFEGYIQPVRLAGGKPEALERVYLDGEPRKTRHGAKAKPSGWQVITEDDAGLVYVLMRPNAKHGDHKSGGDYVWVFDPAKGEVVREYHLKSHALSIEVSSGEDPKLIATAEHSMELEIYDLDTGKMDRVIGGWGAAPFTLHAVR